MRRLCIHLEKLHSKAMSGKPRAIERPAIYQYPFFTNLRFCDQNWTQTSTSLREKWVLGQKVT